MSRGGHDSALPVCLIEQNPLGLEYLLSLLRKDPSIQVLRIQDLKDQRETEAAPVIIIDNCSLPLPLGECLRELRFHYPDAKYLVLDHELKREDLLRLLWIKIDGFVPYSEAPRSLLTAVHSVAQGDIWVPREVLREYVQWTRQLRQKDSSGQERMTSRENQIIELVKRRLSNREIADILGVRESTVKFHLSNVYSKLQVVSRRDLIKNGPEFSALGLSASVLSHWESKA